MMFSLLFITLTPCKFIYLEQSWFSNQFTYISISKVKLIGATLLSLTINLVCKEWVTCNSGTISLDFVFREENCTPSDTIKILCTEI